MYNIADSASNEKLLALHGRISSIIKGKDEAVMLCLAALIAKGHLLIEDVPGVGKTTLAYTMAGAVDCSFQRIQFTSDLMPADIIGVSVYNQETREFEFRRGPLFTNIVLADEINRTTPKTQSALLEAMSERRVTVDRETFVLPEPFMVIATQNPLEYRGTFPLPESQLDRFAMHIKLGYPPESVEMQAVTDYRDFGEIEKLGPVIHASEVVAIQSDVGRVRASEDVLTYLLSIVRATREHDRIVLGVSTRGAQSLLRVAKAMAYFRGRDFIAPEDVKDVAAPVLGHRLMLAKHAAIGEADDLVHEILKRVAVPF